jgi:hypothetical protein
MPTKSFTFTEEMISEAKKRCRKSCKNNCKKKCKSKNHNPLPSALENINHDFALIAWDTYIHMVPILKRALGRRSSKGTLTRNKRKPLFNLIWKNGKFELHILQKWAATTLELPEVYTCSKTQPIEAYTEIVCGFISQ